MSDAYDPTDRGDIKDATSVAKQAQLRSDAVIRGVMGFEDGREWMFNLLASCHIHRTTFDESSRKSAFMEGERNVGLQLEAAILRVCPDDFITMMREAHGRELTDDTLRRNRKLQRDAERKRNDEPDLTNFVNYRTVTAEPADGQVEREE